MHRGDPGQREGRMGDRHRRLAGAGCVSANHPDRLVPFTLKSPVMGNVKARGVPAWSFFATSVGSWPLADIQQDTLPVP